MLLHSAKTWLFSVAMHCFLSLEQTKDGIMNTASVTDLQCSLKFTPLWEIVPLPLSLSEAMRSLTFRHLGGCKTTLCFWLNRNVSETIAWLLNTPRLTLSPLKSVSNVHWPDIALWFNRVDNAVINFLISSMQYILRQTFLRFVVYF